MHVDSENCHSIRCAHTPHTGADEATNLSAMPGIPHTRRHLVSKRDSFHDDFSSFRYSFESCTPSKESKTQRGSSRKPRLAKTPRPGSHYLRFGQKWGEESIGQWYRPTPFAFDA